MYLTIDTKPNLDESNPQTKVTIFGITDFQVEDRGITLFWPYGSALDDTETFVDGVITAGGSLASLDRKTFADLISDNSYVNYSIIVEDPYKTHQFLSRRELTELLSDTRPDINALCGADSIVVISPHDGYDLTTMTTFPNIEQFMDSQKQ